jgi:hypothetical protein
MANNFIKFWMAAILLLTATFSFAGPLDLVITTSDREVSLCVGNDRTLKVFVTDTVGQITAFRYQWFYSAAPILPSEDGWTEVDGATSDVLSLTNVAVANAGYYYCKIFFGMSFSNTRNSERIHVGVVAAKPNITTVYAPADPCEGSLLLMQVDASGYDVRSWYHNGEVVSHGREYRVASVTTDDAGEYMFVASNACGDSVYGPFEVSIIELPRIVTQPRSAGICAGDDLHFIVHATGSDLQYQWYYDGAPYYEPDNHSETNDTLTISQAAYDPQLYSNTFNVQVSNVCATVTSINVGTIVSEMPEVVGSPIDETVCAGTEVHLSADATTHYPIDTIEYQWYFEGRPIEGENQNILTFAMDSAHMGEYYCEFTNGCGTVRSGTAYAMVKMPPTVETQPVDVFVCEGELAQMYTKITGLEPIAYTWLNSNGEGLDFTDITTDNTTGVHTNTLVADPTSESHERYYYCYATNECGYVRTDTVFLKVNQHIQIYPEMPATFSACSGVDTIISIVDRVYQGSDLLDEDDFEEEGITFAWHRQGETEIISTEPYLHFASLQDDDAGRYVCDITNSCGTDENGPILVTVISSPVITVQPHDIDVCTGGSLSLSLSAEGDGIRYAWYRNDEYLGNNSPTYTAPTVAAQYGGLYYCKVESELGCPTAYSDTVMVTVGTTPAISWQPTPAVMAICEGEEYALRMRATGDGLHYQWYNNGNELAGQTSDSLYIAHVTRNNSGVFYCIASNACDEVRTDLAQLTVNNAPDMTLGPDRNPCRGETIVLGPQGDEEYGHYSWNYGTYGYQPTLTVSLGGTYILEVSDSAHGNCVARDTVLVTYHDYFDIAFDSTEVVTCGEFVLDAGIGAAEYQWSTTSISNAITIGMSGYYMVTVDGDGFGCTTSAAVNVTIGEEIIINLGNDFNASVDSVVEIGVPAVFESYIWNTGFTGPRLTVDGSVYGIGPHTFWVQVSNSGCYATDSITINFMEGGYVAEESMPVLSIYPNPASDFVNIVSSNGEMSELMVYDLTGRLVMNKTINSEFATMNVDTLVDATYFVRIVYRDGKTSVGKLIINR